MTTKMPPSPPTKINPYAALGKRNSGAPRNALSSRLCIKQELRKQKQTHRMVDGKQEGVRVKGED